ncbi:GyrI-like domain-containing protein [Pendulispora rubella]|uniref:GyrI-like domain-containing protein n=1 Tax=Pendulispora rubella TaxID=2741070 RepID=A0ABZ2L2Z0_9BACT
MKYAERDAFEVVGIEIRTTNADELSSRGKIPALWQRFFAEGLLEAIPHRKPGAPILAVYSNYENGIHGAYSLLLGTEVTSVDGLPEGFVARAVPKAKYAIFESNQGPTAHVVPDVWKRIWTWNEGARAFVADFEVYDERARDPANAIVDVFISIVAP